MAVEQTLYSLLTTVCPDVFADFAEEPMPSGDFVVYQQITGDVINPIANDVPDLRNSRMQITVWSKSRIRANSLSRQIEDVLRTTELEGLHHDILPHPRRMSDSALAGAAPDGVTV